MFLLGLTAANFDIDMDPMTPNQMCPTLSKIKKYLLLNPMGCCPADSQEWEARNLHFNSTHFDFKLVDGNCLNTLLLFLAIETCVDL